MGNVTASQITQIQFPLKTYLIMTENCPLLPASDAEDVADENANSANANTVILNMPSVTAGDEGRYSAHKIPGEPLKTLLSAVFLGTGFLATTASLSITHERVPDIDPLPDIVLDNIQYQSWGLDVSEYLLMISTISAGVVVMLHTHRMIILRRIWLMLGVLYYYRALTMFVTNLPKADKNYTCTSKKNDITALDYIKRMITIISGGGLSINGKHVYCGDYIFSGHTMILTMGYLAIKQYSPRRYVILHWISFLFFESNIRGPLPRKYSQPVPEPIKRFFLNNFRRLRRGNSASHETLQI